MKIYLGIELKKYRCNNKKKLDLAVTYSLVHTRHNWYDSKLEGRSEKKKHAKCSI